MIFDSTKPIYLQIVEKIKEEIINGTYSPGEKLPSVRDLAALLSVNPNTVQRALSQLESENLIYTERTNGRFVQKDAFTLDDAKHSQAQIITEQYLQKISALHYSQEQVHALIAEFWPKDNTSTIKEESL